MIQLTDKGSDGDNRKAKLKLHGAKAVEEKDYAGAVIFYTEQFPYFPSDGQNQNLNFVLSPNPN
ncbi:hypothetical protein E2562_000298, partial [Oryza meyeriana var. granulata]